MIPNLWTSIFLTNISIAQTETLWREFEFHEIINAKMNALIDDALYAYVNDHKIWK